MTLLMLFYAFGFACGLALGILCTCLLRAHVIGK